MSNSFQKISKMNDQLKAQKRFIIECDNEFSYRTYLDGPMYQTAFSEIVEYLNKKDEESPTQEGSNEISIYIEIKNKMFHFLKDYL